jgi:putative inorganic carbon (HCO3(-)) transporter
MEDMTRPGASPFSGPQFLEAASRLSLYLLAFSLPLVLVTATDEWFSIPKVVVLRAVTVIALTAWALWVIQRRQWPLRATPLDKPILVFLAVQVVTTIFSVSPYVSLYGLHFRQDGLITILNWVVVFFLAVNHLRKPAHVRRIMAVWVVGGCVVAGTSILQHFGFRLFDMDPYFFGARVFGTLGNPDFLGTYLVMTFPLTIGLFLTTGRPWEKALWSGSFAALIISLVYTFTRDAWLGGAFALAVLLVLFWRQAIAHRFWFIGVAMVLGAFLVATQSGMLAGLRVQGEEGAPDVPAVSRTISSMGEVGSGTAEVRLLMWRGTLEMIADNPLLGVGINGFMPIFSRYAPVEYARGEGLERFPDKAHNDFLNILANQGIVGFGVYLWLIIALGVAFFRHLRNQIDNRNPAYPLLLALFAAWIGYLAQSFFLFPTVDTGALFWLMMGSMVSLMVKPEQELVWQFSLKNLSAWIVRVEVLVLGGVLLFLSAKPLVGDVYFRQAQAALQKTHHDSDATDQVGLMNESIRLNKLAIAWNPGDEEYYRRTAAAYGIRAGLAQDAEEHKHYLDEGLTYLDKAVEQNPQMAHLYYLRGQHLESYGEDRLLEALDNYREATMLFPLYWNGNAAMSELAHDLGKFDEAIIAERQMMKIFPHSAVVALNLGRHYITVGRLDEAVETFKGVLRFDAEDAELNYWLGEAYRLKDNNDQARFYLELALSYDPDMELARQSLESLAGRE